MIPTLALLCLAGVGGHAAPVFPSTVRSVVLHPTVRDDRGEIVTGLDRAAFTVYENGRRQPITIFHRDDVPVSLGILIDNSGSMARLRAKVEAAALRFADASNPQDEMFVLNFADKPSLDVPFTGERGVLEAGIARVDSIGGTALRDAIEAAETYLNAHATRERKALLLITDGNDNASVTPAERIRRQAVESDIAIFAVGLLLEGDPHKAGRAHHELDQLTRASGGFAEYPPSLDDVEAAVLSVARQIRSEYTLGYTPLDQALDGSYRRLRVAVKAAGHLSVQARSGYRATPDK